MINQRRLYNFFYQNSSHFFFKSYNQMTVSPSLINSQVALGILVLWMRYHSQSSLLLAGACCWASVGLKEQSKVVFWGPIDSRYIDPHIHNPFIRTYLKRYTHKLKLLFFVDEKPVDKWLHAADHQLLLRLHCKQMVRIYMFDAHIIFPNINIYFFNMVLV